MRLYLYHKKGCNSTNNMVISVDFSYENKQHLKKLN